MASTAAPAGPPVLCGGIQHKNIEAYALLCLLAQTDAEIAYLTEKWHNIRGGWHSKECTFIADTKSIYRNPRCPQCHCTYSNIRESRYPELFREQPADKAPSASPDPADEPEAQNVTPPLELISGTPKSSVGTKPVSDQIFLHDNLLRDRLCELVPPDHLGELEPHPELSVAAKALKLKGQFTFPIDESRLFVACRVDGCNCVSVKKARANVDTRCDRCHKQAHNEKRKAARKEANKDRRVDPKSTVNFRYFDNGELKLRAQSLNAN